MRESKDSCIKCSSYVKSESSGYILCIKGVCVCV